MTKNIEVYLKRWLMQFWMSEQFDKTIILLENELSKVATVVSRLHGWIDNSVPRY
jgi:hypothetical protein